VTKLEISTRHSTSLFIQIHHCKSIIGARWETRKRLCFCGLLNSENTMMKEKWPAQTGEVWVKDREGFSLQCWSVEPRLYGPDKSAGLHLFFCSSPLPHLAQSVLLSHFLPGFFSYPAFCLISSFALTLHLPAFITTHSPLLLSSPSSSWHVSLLPVLIPTREFSLFSPFTLTGSVRDRPCPNYLPHIPRAFLPLSAVCEGLCTFSSPAISK